MSENSKLKKNSFIIQGSILALAGVLVRVIGTIYRIPLTRILGDEGNGYYSTAFDIYNILILLSSQGLPLAVSKIVSERLEKKEYTNAHKVFKGSLIFALIIGVVIGLFAFFGADWLAATVYKSAPSARALKVLAPTLTVVCFLGVIRGYFQGMGNMVPTAVSQIFEQIVNAVVSILAALQLVVYGGTVAESMNLSQKEVATYKASFGAMGGTIGTLCGAVAALLIMIFILLRFYKKIKIAIKSDTTANKESYSTIMKVVVLTVAPIILSTTIYSISNLIDNPIYQNIMSGVFHVDLTSRAQDWGIYSGKYRILTTMPIAIAMSLAVAVVPSLVRSYVAKDKDIIKEKMLMAYKFCMIIAIPCGIGLSVLGGPINNLLFGDTNSETAIMMIFAISTVFTFSLSSISNAILQGIDHLSIPIKNSAISLGIHIVILPLMLIFTNLGIYAVVICDMLFALVVCILNEFSIRKFIDYKHDIKNTFLRPLLCSLIMGVIAFAIYYLSQMIFKMNTVSTIISIVVAIIVYGLLLIKTKTVTEAELENVPKGNLIIKIFKKIKIL